MMTSSFEEWVTQDTPSELAITSFTAYRQHDEPWRLSRLKDVYETAQQISALVFHRQFPNDVVIRMHDHKGGLTVQFLDDDWEAELQAVFHLAWRGANEEEIATCTITGTGCSPRPWDYANVQA